MEAHAESAAETPDQTCPICREPLEASNWKCPQCKNDIHAHCIIGAVEHDQHGQRCPMCRADITESLREICGEDVPLGGAGAGAGAGGAGMGVIHVENAVDLQSFLGRALAEIIERRRQMHDAHNPVEIIPGYCATIHAMVDIAPQLAQLFEDWDTFIDIVAYITMCMQTNGDLERQRNEHMLYEHRAVPNRTAGNSDDAVPPAREFGIKNVVMAITRALPLVESHFAEYEARVRATGEHHRDVCATLRACLIWLHVVGPCSGV